MKPKTFDNIRRKYGKNGDGASDGVEMQKDISRLINEVLRCRKELKDKRFKCMELDLKIKKYEVAHDT